MARIPPMEYEKADPLTRLEYDRQLEAHGRLTNMKMTLGHSPVALKSLMEWYPLRAEVVPFLGERLATLFAHAISSRTDCLICSTFFRRILIQSGENPDELSLDEREQTVVDYGRQLAQDSHGVDDALYARLSRFFGAKEIVALTAFAGLMIATNIFNNALGIELDEYLQPFRRGAK